MENSRYSLSGNSQCARSTGRSRGAYPHLFMVGYGWLRLVWLPKPSVIIRLGHGHLLETQTPSSLTKFLDIYIYEECFGLGMIQAYEPSSIHPVVRHMPLNQPMRSITGGSIISSNRDRAGPSRTTVCFGLLI